MTSSKQKALYMAGKMGKSIGLPFDEKKPTIILQRKKLDDGTQYKSPAPQYKDKDGKYYLTPIAKNNKRYG